MKKLLLAMSVVGIFAQSAFAGCESAYTERIKALEGRMNPARGVLISNAAGVVIAQSIIYSSVGAITVAGAVTLPAVAAGAGGYYAVLLIERARLRTANHLIRDAKRGSGEDLENLVQRINARNETVLTIEEVANAIKLANDNNEFCKVNENTDKAKLSKPHQFMKQTEELLGLN